MENKWTTIQNTPQITVETLEHCNEFFFDIKILAKCCHITNSHSHSKEIFFDFKTNIRKIYRIFNDHFNIYKSKYKWQLLKNI
jgi:hypothetical protein